MAQTSLYQTENEREPQAILPRRRIDHVQLPKIESSLPKVSADKKKHLAQEGVQDASKEAIKVEKINEDRFKNLVRASNQTLYSTRSVFPFDFFPDEISVEITQVNVAKHYFFATSHLQTIPIKNVADVFVETSPFFASLKIIDSSYIENSIQVEYLKKDEACLLRRIIQGLVIAYKEEIDLAKIPTNVLIKNVESLGKAAELELGL